MKKLGISLLFMLLSLLPTAGFGDGSPSFYSEVPGVSIWVLRNDGNLPYESSDDKNYEFISYCDSKNSVYIHELGERTSCTAISVYKNEMYQIYLSYTKADLKGKITVSKNSFGKATYTVTKPSIKEMKSLATMVASKRLALDIKNKNYINESFQPRERNEATSNYEKFLNEGLFKNQITKRFAINAKNKKFFIIPIGAEWQGLGWDLRSAVFLNINGKPKYLGEINGCLDNILDITSDGIPEVGTALCENDEGTYHAYSSIFPIIKNIVSRSDS